MGAFGDRVPQLRDCAPLEGGTGYVKVEGREIYDHSLPSRVGSLWDGEEMGRIASLWGYLCDDSLCQQSGDVMGQRSPVG